MPFLLSAGSVGKTVLEFAVLISVIVFFHELGHLLVGKLCGVKALRFSIGFGPKLFSFQWGETEYRLSALPLGGYVKFAGDNPHEELAPADRGRGFLEQPPGKKAAIAFAGPAANFVLAVVLYFVVFATPHRDLSSAVGYVKPGSPAAAAGIRYGDKVVAVDGEKVLGFLALQEKIRAHAGEPLTLQLLRDGQERVVRVVPSVHEETNPIETIRQGRIGISATPRAPELAVISPASLAGKAGLRDFDTVARLDGAPIANYEQFAQEVERKLAQGKASLDIEVLRRQEVPAPGGTLWTLAPARATVTVPARARSAEDLGIESADMTVFAVQPGSAAAEAGLRRGDRLLSVQGQKVSWWYDDVETLRRAAGASPLDLVVRRDGRALTLTVRQHLRKARDETGARVDVPELGAAPDSAVFNGEPERIWIQFGVGEAAQRAVADTIGATRQMALGIYKIFTGHISSEAIGGPLMIADVARKAADDGWQAFVAVMAIISVNLGLMNLVPLPVLDGFHVLSAGIESISRRPLSLRFREVANVVGLVLVLGLMIFAFKNDIVRKFLPLE
ncbi:MAG TPA: RIP metalloprotease RseP [Myxococcales bacterium]|jgi:regulator of sigma E protease|nr:RIP metalloprotease RseP [Myxococcales bacterium]